jgi:hypothetical protein
MLAAARAGGAAGSGTVPPRANEAAPVAAKAKAEAPPADVESAAEEAVTESPPAAEAIPTTGDTIRPVDKSNMSVDEIVAYCRQHDAK